MGVGVPEGLFLDQEFMDDALRDFLTPRGHGGESKVDGQGDVGDGEALNGEEPINQFTSSGGLAEVGDFEVPE